LEPALGWTVAASGVLGIFCSMMLYQVTSRRWWSAARTSVRFAGTSVVLGLSTTSVTLFLSGLFAGDGEWAWAASKSLMLPLSLLTLLKLGTDASILLHLSARGLGELKRTATLLVGELRAQAAARAVLGALGALLALLLSRESELGAGASLAILCVVWALLLAAELLERTLFFRALSAPTMPGAVGP
jgi:DMSO reductase anchor subunit